MSHETLFSLNKIATIHVKTIALAHLHIRRRDIHTYIHVYGYKYFSP